MTRHEIMWLVAEQCDASIYSGWHIYLRDTKHPQRNKDGSWGWIRRDHWLLPHIHAFLGTLGISMRRSGDGSCDDDGYAELARRHPIGDDRGGVAVILAADGALSMAIDPSLDTPEWPDH